jgi:hypothetical protein
VSAGRTAAVEAEKADENVPAPGPEDAGAKVAGEKLVSGEPKDRAPAKNGPKRRSPVSKASDAKAQDAPRGRGEAGGQHGGTRVDAGGPAAPGVDPIDQTSPNRYGLPTVDPMADLVGLAEPSLLESLESLRSVSESRTLSELVERQSRHMRLMTEIWMRQVQRSVEVFNVMLSQRRE